ncbi:unnamed protein product [Ceratitis capitata]|uniref:(Mediterranean fruit fly) hypothetical protein n=1 Tax=Ceratitis capitata TaxID=7213 RepID=A0A811VJM1_CERCA|nr:unnamed protein product [Ceratitis capitata]
MTWRGCLIPEKYGMHEIVVEIGEDSLGGHFFRVLPRFIQVAPPGMAPCALGSLASRGTGKRHRCAQDRRHTRDCRLTDRHITQLSTEEGRGGHSAIFKPDEAGIWEIAITYQGRHIQGGPFTCAVFDASGVSVHGLDGAMPLRAHSFEVDARGVGVNGELHVDMCTTNAHWCVLWRKIVEINIASFMPRQNGKYRVYVYFNGYDVKGSPFIMRVGTKGRSGKTRSSPLHESKHRSESPSMHYTSTTNTRHNDYRNATSAATASLSRRDLLNHNSSERQRSYSPQVASNIDTPDYRTTAWDNLTKPNQYAPLLTASHPTL